jgi:hypothetical protein
MSLTWNRQYLGKTVVRLLIAHLARAGQPS